MVLPVRIHRLMTLQTSGRRAIVAWGERGQWAGVALLAFILLAVAATFIQGRRMASLGQSIAGESESAPVTGAVWTHA